MARFVERYMLLVAERTQLCVGVDPSIGELERWQLSPDVNGLRRYCDILLEAIGGSIAVIKPQSAFFEQFGPDGMKELSRVISAIRDQGALALLDCKRGDIGSTMEAYGQAFIGRESAFGADAITVTPYLGIDALRPVFDLAASRDGAIFVVVRSSNPEGATLQSASTQNGHSVAEELSISITRVNESYGSDVGPVGAVVGATLSDVDAKIVHRLPKSLLLAPGVGAQGARLQDMAFKFGDASSRVLPSVSRAVSSAGPSIEAIRGKIDELKGESLATFRGRS